MRPEINIIDCQTGETITREMNDLEYEHYLLIVKESEQEQSNNTTE